MYSVKIYFACLLYAVLSIASLAKCESSEQIRWPKSYAEVLQSNSLSTSTVESFVNSVAMSAELPFLKVQEFRFAYLEPGRPYLVASIDSSGRDLYFAVIVVGPPGSEPRFRILNSAPPHLLANELLDLDGKGVDLLIRKDLVGLYQGSGSAPLFWYSIWRMRNGALEDVSAQYPRFYQSALLPSVSFIEGALTSDTRKQEQSNLRYLAQAAYVLFKYQRVVNDKTTAGLDAARRWKESSDRQVKLLAIDTFSDINNPEAISLLREMSNSPDLTIAQAAKMALEKNRH